METNDTLAEQCKVLIRDIRTIGKALREQNPKFTMGDLADAIRGHRWHQDLNWPVAPMVVGKIIRGLAPRNRIRRSLPPRPAYDAPEADREVAFATRAAWRHLMFAIGHNVNLGGLMSAAFECKGNGNVVAQAIVDALVPPAASVGLREWHGAMYGR